MPLRIPAYAIATTSPRAPDPLCVAPVMVDGGTRFALDFDPTGMATEMSVLIQHLRHPRTREQDKEDRKRGGLFMPLPMPGEWESSSSKKNGSRFWSDPSAEVKVSGVRRQVITFHVNSYIYLYLNVESGEARLQLRAPVLWADGYEKAATFWLDAVLWMLTRTRCTLKEATHMGWRMTGLEVCSDIVGLHFWRHDADNFVGIVKTGERHHLIPEDQIQQAPTPQVRTFGIEAQKAETIDIGSRASPVSICIYDKESQIIAEKGGDWSTYEAVHKSNGWDGEAKIWRVELRFTKRGLVLEDKRGLRRLNPLTNKVENLPLLYDFRDPATAANEYALWLLWSYTTSRKRLIIPKARTRRKRCPMDWRWEVVSGICVPDREKLNNLRMYREVQKDAWKERTRRALMEYCRSGRRLAALYDQPNYLPEQVAQFAEDQLDDDERRLIGDYLKNYRGAQDPFIGDEIRRLGGTIWETWKVPPPPPPVQEEPPQWIQVKNPAKTYTIKRQTTH